jgi:hypothetical protein
MVRRAGKVDLGFILKFGCGSPLAARLLLWQSRRVRGGIGQARGEPVDFRIFFVGKCGGQSERGGSPQTFLVQMGERRVSSLRMRCRSGDEVVEVDALCPSRWMADGRPRIADRGSGGRRGRSANALSYLVTGWTRGARSFSLIASGFRPARQARAGRGDGSLSLRGARSCFGRAGRQVLPRSEELPE